MKDPGNPESANLTRTIIATCFGTAIEWYDFAVFGQLTPILSQVFFPSSDPASQKLQIWGIFALSFIARPIGAVLFAHLGDTKGRGVCLLATVLTMGIPTVILGFLPTYRHIGISAAVLLGILRFIQGLAIGGEFGAAMVYMFETAPPKYKSLAASLGYVSLGSGMVTGNLVTLAVVAGTTAEDLLAWGWRVPFLMAFLTVEAAIVLRWNLVDSTEFTASREQLNQEYQQRHEQRQQMGPQMRSNSMLLRRSNSMNPRRQQPQVLMRSNSLDTRRRQVELPAAGIADIGSTEPADKDVDVESLGQAEPQYKTQRYVPIVEVFRNHWKALLLHIFAQSGGGTWFYIATGWLATLFVRLGTPERTTLWMNISGLTIMTIVAPVTGWLADQGYGRVRLSMAMSALMSCCAVPIFLGLSLRNLALDWVLHNLCLAMLGVLVGLLPSTYCLLYPAGVRISGFNMAFSLCLVPFGGAVPLILTALQNSTGSMFIAPGIYAAFMSAMSAIAHAFIWKMYPDIDKSQGISSRQP